MRNPLKVIATVGLVLGGVFGIAGTILTPPLQAILWAIDGAGLVMATVLLTIKCFRTGNDVVAGGFLVFAIGEGVVLRARQPILRVASHRLPLVLLCGEPRCFL